LQSLQIPLENGRTVPLGQLATFEFGQEHPLIWRRQRIPTLTVQADAASGMTPQGAVAALNPAIEKLNASLPADYRIEVGGTVAESGNSQRSAVARVR
jgi:multidrug efflux pump subunit AcrB